MPTGTLGLQYVSQRFYRRKSLKHRKQLAKLEADMAWADELIEYRKERESEQDKPLSDPCPLHVVWRVRSLCGRPWWEKDIITKLGLEEQTVHTYT